MIVLFFEHVLLYNLKKICQKNTCPWIKQKWCGKEDVTILTYSRMRHHVLQAVKTLEKDGLTQKLLILSLKPLDFETIGASVRKSSSDHR